VYVADDDESPRGGVRRWNALPLLLIAIGGAYGVLIVAARLSPQFAASVPWHLLGMNGPELPFVAQLATAFAGLAGLVMVLSRAVREVDKHPYASIAPVLAVFSGLLHTGLRVDLSAWGLSSTQLTVLVLALALLGGVLVGNQRLSARLFGWALVIAPAALVVALVAGVGPPGMAVPSVAQPSERLFLVLLVGSALLLGVAGAVARRLLGQAGAVHAGGLDGSGWTGSELGAELPVEYPGRRRGAPWNRGFSRSAQATAVVLAVAAGAYIAVDRLKHGGTSSEASGAAFASSPVGAPIVEQLDPASVARAKAAAEAAAASVPQKRQRPGKQSSARGAGQAMAAGFGASERAAAPQQPARPAAPSKRASAPAPAPRSARGASSRAQGGASSALPAWGAEATREFSGAKPSKAAASKPAPAPVAPAPVAASKPAPVAPGRPAPVAAAKPVPEPASPPAAAASQPTSGRGAIPPPFSRPVAPAAAPPPKEENLTMDQLLNRVVGAARENRISEGKGAKGPKSEKDNELEDLLDQAMKSPPKKK
jgi:hypothetical protein